MSLCLLKCFLLPADKVPELLGFASLKVGCLEGDMIDSAIWLTCRNCGDTTRVLALMANRVLKARTHCPACRSTCEPCINQTPAGRGLTLSVEQSGALREMDDKTARAWLEDRAHRSNSHFMPLHWMHAAGSRLADRFRKGGKSHFAPGHRIAGKPSDNGRHGDNAFHGTGTISGTGSAAAIRL